MKAAQDSSDRSACAASSFDYEDFFSVLMYYGHMSKDDILNSSREFLVGIYQKYVKRACENLGVSEDDGDVESNTPGKTTLTDADYPKEFISFTQAQREKEIKESGITDEQFLSRFKEYQKPKHRG